MWDCERSLHASEACRKRFRTNGQERECLATPRQGVPPGALVLLASATHSCPHSHVGAAPVFSPRSTKNVRPLKTSTRVSLTKIDGVKRMPVRCST